MALAFVLGKVFTHWNMGVSSISFGISGREDSVNKHKCANNLCSKASTIGVPFSDCVGTTTKPLIEVWLEPLNYTSTTYSSQALHDYVKNCPCQRELACQEQPKRHCWVNMTPCIRKFTQATLGKKK